MRMLIPLLIKYPRLVQEVDADLSRTMDDLLVAQDDAYMGDVSVLIAEEGQVARLGLLQEIHQLAFLHLLRGIAGEKESAQTGADLHQSRTIDAKCRAATPEIGSAEEHFGIVHHYFGMEYIGHLNSLGMRLIKWRAQSQELALVFRYGFINKVFLSRCCSLPR